ncbi:IS66 family transposase [Cardinium endosymbiont of Nabis limbatus]|uniref:IS66 family transposase n=1 Tax=Cardinium endosymbiont of Nabis limbatus TaxID=3066217 RepID=UPI003AF3DEC3
MVTVSVCIFKNFFNLDISLGGSSNSEARVASKCKAAYQAIETTIKANKVLHIDEMGHYNSSKLNWGWVFTNNMTTLFKFTNSRSRKVLEKSGLNPKQHIVVSDRYAVYSYFPPTNRQLCWAHIARDYAVEI